MADNVVTVFFATGQQGGSVIQALLQSGGWKIRGVSRTPASDKAQLLQKQGVELVQGDIKDTLSVQAAVRGAYAVFAVTPAPGDWSAEGKQIATAAKQAGVQHFIWSTLANVEKVSEGQWVVPHWTGKAVVDEHIASLHFPHHTFIMPAFYFQNFATFFARTGPDGTVVFTLPMKGSTLIPGFDVSTDLGRAVAGILRAPEVWGQGAFVRFAPTFAPLSEYIETFQRVTGKTARLNTVTREQFVANFPPPAKQLATDLSQGFAWYETHGYFGDDGVEPNNAKELVPELHTFEDWLKRTGWKA